MRRLLALYILTHLFSVGVGGLLGYGLYPALHRSRSYSNLSEPLTEADLQQRSQEGKS
jgi:hypothetical protein